MDYRRVLRYLLLAMLISIISILAYFDKKATYNSREVIRDMKDQSVLKKRSSDFAAIWPPYTNNLYLVEEFSSPSLIISPQATTTISGTLRWLSILCKFSDIPDEPKSLDYFIEMYGENYGELDHYWRELSFDKINLQNSGAVGWYTLPQPLDYYLYDENGDGRPDFHFYSAGHDCIAAAALDGVNLADYFAFNLFFNAEWGGPFIASTVWYEGQAYRATWEIAYCSLNYVQHEMGHVLGLPHSSGKYGYTYDNIWDVMSNSYDSCALNPQPVYGCTAQHTIAYHKDLLGWIESEQRLEIPPGFHETVTLERLALPQTNNTLAIFVLIDDEYDYFDYFYTVEAREPVGYDVSMPGKAVVIHEVNTWRTNPAHIIDVDYKGETGVDGTMWLVGEVFFDPHYGIYISVDQETPTGFVTTVYNNVPGLYMTGPTLLTTGMIGEYFVMASPYTLTKPITYTWQTSDWPEFIQVSEYLSDTIDLFWENEGTKTVSVTAQNQYTNFMTVYTVIVTAPVPVADFMASPLTGHAPLGVTFTDISSGTITTWEWDFGDGATSTAQHPTHEYSMPGTYTVTLTVTGSGGSDTETKASYITVTHAPPVAAFSATPRTGHAPLNVTFTDTSTGAITAWQWDFGDGDTSTVQHPMHEYAATGVYTVTLTVTGLGGSNTAKKTNYITVTEASPVADFTATPLAGQPPLTVVFTDTSRGTITSWLWDFGDGITNTEPNPTHEYTTAGTYTVTLTVSGPGGSDMKIKTDYITVTEAPDDHYYVYLPLVLRSQTSVKTTTKPLGATSKRPTQKLYPR